MRFSLIHPSLGRPEQAIGCLYNWRAFAPDAEIQHLLSLSSSDTTIGSYMSLFDNEDSAIVISPSTNMVSASNIAAERADGDVLILISDDMFPPMGWDIKITPYLDVHWPVVLQVHDGIRDDIMTLPIMNRAAYDRLGYLYHPDYLSMFADNDLAETAKTQGWYVKCEVRFEHRHYTVGKAELDETYRKENSKVKWDHGQRVFERRKRDGFPVR